MRQLIVLLILVTLTGCATTYQAEGFTGGFTETQLAPDIFEVRFNGNGYTRTQRASDLALLRSAELTLEKGYKYFFILSGRSDVEQSSYITPSNTVTTGSIQSYGNTAYVNAQSQTYGGQVVNVAKPSSVNLIKLLANKPADPIVAFDAAFICESIGTKYKVACGAGKR